MTTSVNITITCVVCGPLDRRSLDTRRSDPHFDSYMGNANSLTLPPVVVRCLALGHRIEVQP